MWFLLKSTFGFAGLLVLAYVLFFVEAGGQPLGGHLVDIWSSDTVQHKVALVKAGVRNELEDRLAEMAERSARRAVREQFDGEPHDIAPEDRESLDQVIAGN